MDAYMGEIKMFAGTFAPRGYLFCDGSILPINQYSALFSLLGTTYGGDGMTNFQLPDMRGRVPVHAANGLGGTAWRPLGGQFGTNTVTLNNSNLPAHNHLGPSAAVQTSDKPGAGLAPAPGGSYGTVTQTAGMAPGQTTGSNVPFDNTQPSLVINFIICIEGIYPSRP